MVPNDQQRTNAGVVDMLVVRQSIVTPQVKTENLIVNGTSIFQDSATFQSNITVQGTVTFQGTSDTFTVNTLNGTIGNFTTINVASGITTSDLTAVDVVSTSVTTVNLLANDIKTNLFQASSAILTDTLNQLTLGTTKTIILSAPTPAASRIYTLPDVLANASFVMTEGTQTINGAKTFTTAPSFPGGLSFNALTLSNVTNQLTMGTGNLITVNAPTPAASRTYTVPDVLSNASFVMSEGAQTLNGVMTFSATAVFLAGFSIASLTLSAVTNQLTLGTGQTIIVNAPTPASSRTYTLPDVLANASFVMTEGAQTVNGTKTFTSAPVFPSISATSLTLTNTSNQLIMGTGQTITINSPTPAASRIYTTPDVLANASFVMTEGSQTLNGTKIFSSTVTINPTTNQLILGVTQTITLTAPTPAASRVYTLPDVLNNASFVMTEGAQTINGTKTFTSAPVFPALSFASLTLTNTTNQLTLGTTNTTTISSVAPAASRTYTIQDALTNANFIMSEGIQTLNGAKTFSTSLTINPTTNQLVLGVTNTITINSVAPSASRTYTIPDAGTNTSFVMGASNQTIAGTKTFSAAVVVNPTTNQLVLGVTNTTTINSVAPSASRTYTIPDAGADTSFVMAAGTQTIGGAKTFSTQIIVNPTTNQLVLGVTNTTTINSTAPSASRTYTIPDAGTNTSFVMAAGTQTIAGAKTFSTQVVINPTTNQLVLGVTNTTTINSVAPAASRTYTIPDAGTNSSFVMTDGTQTINGSKTYSGLATFNDIVTITVASTVSSLTFTDTTNQITLGTFPLQTVITAPAPATTRNYTIPDATADASFVLSTQSTVGQLTNITTSVSIDGPSGVITTQAATAASGATQTFTVNNTFCTSTSVVVADLHQYSGTYLTNGIPYVRVTTVANTSFNISVINIHGTNALNGTLVIHFIVC